ncbi:PTS sugar transporter subunit IIC [Sporolactobacillus inulinus]|nr:PTS sugar transporter subunit IIC [Sporolactobacillus inulinus]
MGPGCYNGGFTHCFPFIGILAGSDAINAFVKAIPKVIMNGLNICGGLLPAVGMAMLLKLLWDKKIYAFFFLGFVMVAYLKLPLIALAVLGAIIAVMIAQRDYQLSQLTKKVNAAPAAAAPAGSAGNLDAEEEDFFDE